MPSMMFVRLKLCANVFTLFVLFQDYVEKGNLGTKELKEKKLLTGPVKSSIHSAASFSSTRPIPCRVASVQNCCLQCDQKRFGEKTPKTT
jgi:hypothetical protein